MEEEKERLRLLTWLLYHTVAAISGAWSGYTAAAGLSASSLKHSLGLRSILPQVENYISIQIIYIMKC